MLSHYTLALSFLSSLVSIASAQEQGKGNQGAPATIAALKNNSIVPQVLPASFTPVLDVGMTWSSGSASVIGFAVGDTLTLQDVTPAPNLTLFEDPTLQGPGVDPSTPCCSFANLTSMSFLWVVSDPDGSNLLFMAKDMVASTTNSLDNGTSVLGWPMTNRTPAVAEYETSGLPHHNVVAIYQQPSSGSFSVPSTAAPRTGFNITNFVQEVPGLTLVAASVFFVISGSSGSSTISSSATSPATSIMRSLTTPYTTQVPGIGPPTGGLNSTSPTATSGAVAMPFVEFWKPLFFSLIAMLVGVGIGVDITL